MPRHRSRQPRVHFTRAGTVKPIVEFFDEIGCPTWRYLSQAHLSQTLLEDPDAPVPVRLLYDFVERASRAEGIDHPGLQVAKSVSLNELGTFGDLLLRSRNVFHYLQTGCRFISRVTTNARFWLECGQDQVRFCHSEVDVDRPLEGHLYVLCITINTLRSAAGEHWVPSEVSLPVEPLPCLAAIAPSFCNARVDPARRHASVCIPLSFLTFPLRAHDCHGLPAEELDFATPHPIDFRDSMRRLAEVLVHDGHSDLPSAAEASGMSVRTLQRRLAECDLSFSRLTLEARISLSERWLREKDRPITDIAQALGYNDSANFSRAFRRVNGLSPRAYRESFSPEKLGTGRLALS